MNNEYTLTFAQIKPQDRELAGGKGLSLGLLSSLNVAVPEGFILTTHCFHAFLKHNDIDDLSPDSKEKVLNGSFPEFILTELKQQLQQLGGTRFAVRSSSVSEDSEDKSFAGMFDTVLNVSVDNILEAIKACYASIFSAHVICYRDQAELIAVVVQKMVDSQASGVMFTNHPLTGAKDVIVIESCPGLGEPLVAGMITPDLYVVDKISGTILRKIKQDHKSKMVCDHDGAKTIPTDGSELKLNTCHIRHLVGYARRIETYFGFPCDIEWCIDGEVRIVQSRPITVVSEQKGSQGLVKPSYSKRFSSRILSPIFEQANIEGYWHYGQQLFEFPFSLKGYHLIQPSIIHPKGEVDIWINDSIDSEVDQFIKKMLRRDLSYLPRLEARYLEWVKAFEIFSLAVENTNWQQCSKAQLVDKLNQFDVLNQKMTCLYNAPIFVVGAVGEVLLEEMLAIDPNNADADFITLTLSCMQNPVLQQAIDIDRIYHTARYSYHYHQWSDGILFNPEINQLLKQYHRRWRFLACTDVIGEAFDREYFIKRLKQRFEQGDHGEQARRLQQTQVEQAEFDRVVNKYKVLSYEIRLTRTWLYHRNNTTEDYYRDFQNLKPLWLVVADRLSLSYRDLLNLGVAEMIEGLRSADPAIACEAVERYSQGFTCVNKDHEVELKTGVEFDDRIEKTMPKANEIPGQIANSGRVKGVVKVIKDPILEADTFIENDILVTSMTTPSFVTLMEKSAGIITDEGGILCHAALISRELGKPCLIAVSNATQILQSGDWVELDCQRGIVAKIPPEQ